MSGSIKKIIKKIPFVGSYVKKVQTEKKEEEQKQKLEKKRLELQKEQERIKVWLKSEKQNAPDKNSRKISVIVHHHTGEEQLQKLKENFKEAAAGLEFEVFTADIESKQNTSFAEFCNEAARKATGEYLFFLDESVQLASECLNIHLSSRTAVVIAYQSRIFPCRGSLLGRESPVTHFFCFFNVAVHFYSHSFLNICALSLGMHRKFKSLRLI